MDLALLETIKKTAIQALVSDDVLMDKLILKGGNALDLIHKIAERASFDLDFSIEGTFDDTQLDKLESKIEKLLTSSFERIGYHVFDVSLKKRPNKIKLELDSFWGGYKIDFKLIPLDRYEVLKTEPERVRREATVVGPLNSTKFRIEISRFEHCPLVRQLDVGGYTVKVYSPVLIAIEKLRAICQQMPDYKSIVPTASSSPRARDFFDIYTIVTTCDVNLLSPDNREHLAAVFAAKKVPLDFLKQVKDYHSFHSEDFLAVKDTVKPTADLKDFDFYFEFVVDICEKLHP